MGDLEPLLEQRQHQHLLEIEAQTAERAVDAGRDLGAAVGVLVPRSQQVLLQPLEDFLAHAAGRRNPGAVGR